MRRVILGIVGLSVIAASVCWASLCQAQVRKSLSGSIEVEGGQKKKDPYLAGQDEAIAYFANISSALSAGITKIDPPDAQVNRHLAGVYLYCRSKNGICPVVLEALLELDILHSYFAREVNCPALRNFWREWLAKGFEDRAKYLVNTSNLVTVTDFDQNERPKYLRCKVTIEQELGQYKLGTGLLSDRYGAGKPGAKAIEKMKVLLELIKKKVPNVFRATGAVE